MRASHLSELTLSALLSACATGVVAREPFPILPPAAASLSARLEISPRVKSGFYAQCPDALYLSDEETPTLRIKGWQLTLMKGFYNGFAGARVEAQGAPSRSLRLEIARADLEFVEAGRNAYDRVTSVQAAVHYQIQLVDASGAVLRRSEGTALSRRSSGELADVPDLIASAVEVMYESAARALFVTPG